MLEHDVRLGEQELVAKQPTNLLHIDLVKVVLVQRALEPTQTFENLEDFALGVPMLDVRVLLLLVRERERRLLCGVLVGGRGALGGLLDRVKLSR